MKFIESIEKVVKLLPSMEKPTLRYMCRQCPVPVVICQVDDDLQGRITAQALIDLHFQGEDGEVEIIRYIRPC